jgi:hypothetical protein
MLSFLFMRLFVHLCLAIEHCVKCPCVGDEVKCPCDGVDMKCSYVRDDLSISAGTLKCVKSLATMFESIVPPYPNDSQ